MSSPTDRKYSDSHEWHKLDGDTLTLGLTQFAADSLTDVTYVEMKGVGEQFATGDVIGEVESVKATSDVYCGVSGEIVEHNALLESNPGLVNTDPFGDGWLCKIKVSDAGGMEQLHDAAKYDSDIAH